MSDEQVVRCKRCHRVLTDLNAKQRGYGEQCWRIHLNEKQQKNCLFPLNPRGGKK